jgi:O-antigen ligase
VTTHIPEAITASTRRLRPASAWSRVPRWLACGAIAWGAFAFGAVYPWAYWPLAGVCVGAGLAGLLTRSRAESLHGIGPVAVALGLVAAVVMMQLLPLPGGLLGAVSPRAPELLKELDARFAWQLVSVHGISIDPAATTRALALYVSFGLLMLGLTRSLSRGGTHRLVWTITWLGIALALHGVVQKALSADAIHGFWQPLMTGSPFGPFVNRNHFAGWMLMAIPLALGYFCAAFSRGMATVQPSVRDWFLWLSSPEASKAVQAGFAVILMGLALMLTLSRSGMLSLAVALIVCGYMAVRRQRRALGRSVVFGCLTLSSLLIVLWAGVDAIVARFAALDTMALGGRLPIWHGGVLMLEDFWLTGSGLNTFGVATLFYPPAVPGYHLREAHNDYLQLAIEGGVLLAVPALAAAAAFAVAVRQRFRAGGADAYWIRLGAVAGILAIAVQSLVEFSLQIPGNAVLFATLCAIALHRSALVPPHQNLS